MVDTATIREPELPSMPRANQLSAFDGTFGQRPTLMRANAAQAREIAISIGDTDGSIQEWKLAHLALRWEFEKAGDSGKLAHVCNISRKGDCDFLAPGLTD